MGNIAGLVRPGGTFVTAALRRCRGYVVGDKRFPSADVGEEDLRDVLAARFDAAVEVRELEGHEAQATAASCSRTPSVAADRLRRRAGRSTVASCSPASADIASSRAP
jgi:hypothetical protein